MQDTDLSSQYATKDVYVAAYLISIGFNKYTLERFERQFYFVFDNNDKQNEIKDYVNHYWTDDITVSPKQLFNGFKELKNRMYNGGDI